MVKTHCNSLVPVVTWGIVALCPSVCLAGQDTRAILSLLINLDERGEILVVMQEGDVLACVSDLERAGLRGFAGQRETLAGEPYVSLASLAPTIMYALDEHALTLRLTVPPVFLPPTLLDLAAGRPPGLISSKATSAFLNYAFDWRDVRAFDAFGEAGVSIDGHLLSGSFSLNPAGDVIRGPTSFTVDEPDRLRRWVIGDRFASAGDLGGGIFLGGVSVSREFTLDPYFIRYPTLRLSGAVLTPSTVDIYVNDILLRREQVPPGPYELRNLPGLAGHGATRLVIRDVFGREQEIVSPYYFSTGILARGLSEYSYNVGLRRNQIGTSSWAYGPLAFLGRHRLGLTDALTAGLRLEAATDLVSGGPTVTARFPFGEVALAAAASHQGGLSGAAASLAYTYAGRPVSFGAFARMLSPRYATLSLKPADDRALLETGAFVGFPLGARVSLSLQYAASDFRDQGWVNRVTVLSSARLTQRANLFVSGSHAAGRGSKAENELFAGVSYYFSRNTTGFLAHQQHGERGTSAVSIQKSLPVGSGFGYRLQWQPGGGNDVAGLLQYQGPYGRYEVSYDRVDGRNATTLKASGGVVAIGGSVYPTRPVLDSFALIRVPGVAGVRGYASNQEVGHTNAKGDLLVPNLLSYYGNRLKIDDLDIPLDYSIDATEQTVAPPFRGGALVTFPVQRVQHLTGRLVVDVSGQTVIPAYGQLTIHVADQTVASPLGRQGEFYLEHLTPGRYTATVAYQDGACRFAVDVPVVAQPFLDLGTLRCAVP